MKTADIRMQDEIKRKVATYYGFKGDWDQLVISCEQKIRDGMTGLPTIYIDKALEVAAQYRESGKPELVEQEELWKKVIQITGIQFFTTGSDQNVIIDELSKHYTITKKQHENNNTM